MVEIGDTLELRGGGGKKKEGKASDLVVSDGEKREKWTGKGAGEEANRVF